MSSYANRQRRSQNVPAHWPIHRCRRKQPVQQSPHLDALQPQWSPRSDATARAPALSNCARTARWVSLQAQLDDEHNWIRLIVLRRQKEAAEGNYAILLRVQAGIRVSFVQCEWFPLPSLLVCLLCYAFTYLSLSAFLPLMPLLLGPLSHLILLDKLQR